MVVASLIDSLSKIGAIGGIISFVGVGLLILLVASQSRQIRAMREWIDAEPERQAETAQRVITEVQRRIAAARERRAAQAAGQPVPPAPRPATPAPGTLGATPEARAVAAAKGGDTVTSPADLPNPFESSTPPPAPGTPATPGAGAPGEPPVFAPLAPAGDGESEEPQAGDLDASAPSPYSGQETQAADSLAAYDPLSAATPAARASDPRFVDDFLDEHEGEHRGNRLLFGAGAAALLAGIVLAGVLLFGGGSDSPAPTADGGTTQNGGAGNPTPTPKPGSSSGEVDPADVKVVVLNGTTITGLAQKVTDRLSGAGYDTSTPNTFSSGAQPLSASLIEYRPGHAPDARKVASDLGLDPGSVQPIDSTVSAAAAPTANVVVVTGADLDSSTSGTTG